MKWFVVNYIATYLVCKERKKEKKSDLFGIYFMTHYATLCCVDTVD